MPNPTRAQILNAYEALEELKNVALSAADFCGDTEKYLAWKSEIIAALPPKPQPTMNEIEWDDNKHYLAEAESESGVKVVMLSQSRDFIMCIQPPNAGDVVIGLPQKDLTPTGRRYTPTEVQE